MEKGVDNMSRERGMGMMEGGGGGRDRRRVEEDGSWEIW